MRNRLTPKSIANCQLPCTYLQNKSFHSIDLFYLFALSQQNRCLYVVLLMTIFWCSEALPLRKWKREKTKLNLKNAFQMCSIKLIDFNCSFA